MASYYVALGLEPRAAVSEVRAAYFKRALKVHPDKPGGNKAAFQRLVTAFEVLSDPVQRFEYDKCCGFGACVQNTVMTNAAGGQTGPFYGTSVGLRGSCQSWPASFGRPQRWLRRSLLL